MTFHSLDRETFQTFAKQHGRSDEVGPIATVYDGDADKTGDVRHIGLYGCGKLCAAVCVVLIPGKTDGTFTCKLDSIVVAGDVRRRGLANIIVTRMFGAAMEETGNAITSFFTQAVHPATVRVFKKLGFNDPPLVGAPISGVKVDPANPAAFVTLLQSRYDNGEIPLKLKCALCLARNRKAVPWCNPAHR